MLYILLPYHIRYPFSRDLNIHGEGGPLERSRFLVICVYRTSDGEVKGGTVSSLTALHRQVLCTCLLTIWVLLFQERDVGKLSGPSQRGTIGVSFESSAETIAGIEKMLNRGGLSGDGGKRHFRRLYSYDILTVVQIWHWASTCMYDKVICAL